MKKQKSDQSKLLEFAKQLTLLTNEMTIEIKGGRGLALDPDG